MSASTTNATGKKKHAHKSNYYNDIALRLGHRLYGLEHLHYGYFDGKTPKSVEGVPQAQAAYVRNLLKHVPKKGVKRIFDVGCGTGGVAAELIAKGYEVTALAPDPYLIEKTREHTGGKAKTITDLYENVEDEVPPGSMDLVLMSESCQYVKIEEGFEQHRRFLRDGGYLLVADFFRVKQPDERNPSRSGHKLEEFLAAAERHGFRKVAEQDITKYVAPTMDIYQDFITNRIFPVVGGVLEVIQRAAPRTYWLLSRIFGGKARKLQDKYSKQGADLFQEYKRYMILRFEKQ